METPQVPFAALKGKLRTRDLRYTFLPGPPANAGRVAQLPLSEVAVLQSHSRKWKSRKSEGRDLRYMVPKLRPFKSFREMETPQVRRAGLALHLPAWTAFKCRKSPSLVILIPSLRLEEAMQGVGAFSSDMIGPHAAGALSP
jgi:hypothetical protein